jgi:hypothetical protein
MSIEFLEANQYDEEVLNKCLFTAQKRKGDCVWKRFSS